MRKAVCSFDTDVARLVYLNVTACVSRPARKAARGTVKMTRSRRDASELVLPVIRVLSDLHGNYSAHELAGKNSLRSREALAARRRSRQALCVGQPAEDRRLAAPETP